MLCKVAYLAGRILANARPHQLHWGDQKMWTAISYTECSQMVGLICKASRDSSKAQSLCAAVLRAAVLRAAVFHSKIVRRNR